MRTLCRAVRVALAIDLIAASGSVAAGTIHVNSTAAPSAGFCTLAQAIYLANRANNLGNATPAGATTIAPLDHSVATTVGIGTCTGAGAGANTIDLSSYAGQTITFSTDAADNFWYGPNALPPIASTITIEGHGVTLFIQNGSSPRLRFFFVGADAQAPVTPGYNTPGPGNLTLRNLTLTGGRQKGGASGNGAGAGMGGAIFNQGRLNLNAVTLNDNRATGGDGFRYHVSIAGGGMASDSNGSGGGMGGLVPSGTGDAGANGSGLNGGAGGGTANGLGGIGAGFGGGNSGNGGGGGGRGQNYSSPYGSFIGDGAGGGSGFSGGSGGYGGVYGSSVYSRGGTFGAGGGPNYSAAVNGDGGGGGGVGGGGGPGWGGGGGGGFGGGGAAGGSGGFGAGPRGFAAGATEPGAGGGLGGAIFNHNGLVTLFNCTMTGNQAIGGDSIEGGSSGDGYGGAIFDLNGEVRISFSTLAFNVVAGGTGATTGNASGGAIYVLGYNGAPGFSNVKGTVGSSNSILANSSGGIDYILDQPATVAGGLANNAPAQGLNFFVDLGPNIVMTAASINFGDELPNFNSGDPLLDVLAANHASNAPWTRALLPGSPASFAADCLDYDRALTVAVDERGSLRPASGCDLGAYDGERLFNAGFQVP